MTVELILLIASLPIILMCAYVYNKDADKEPVSILKKLFLYGVISIVPIVLLELLTDNIAILDKSNSVSLFINTFVTIGFIEEGAKWIIVNKAAYNDIEFNHAYDAIIYCVFASLGFALIENILYVFKQGLVIGIFRAVTTIPAHTFNGVLMGYFMGLAKNEDVNNKGKNSKKYMFLSLLIPIVAHTIYDYLIFLENDIATTLFIVFVVAMYIISFRIIKSISDIRRNFDGSSYDSTFRVKTERNEDLFKTTLINVFIVTLGLIAVSSVFIIFNIQI